MERASIIKKVCASIVLTILLSTEFAVGGTTDNTGLVELINVAGRQRMLSQRVAKNYLYEGNKVATAKAAKQLKEAFSMMLVGHKKLSDSINDPEIENLLSFVQMSREDFMEITKKQFSSDNAQLAIDLSESMLEGSQYIVLALDKREKTEKGRTVDKSGRQRMLSQRIAKYYIAYQTGIKDKNTIDQMKAAVKLFDASHKELMANPTNTPIINQKFNEIDRLWKIVQKFYLNIEKGGLPLIVYNTTDKIMKKMNEITGLYVELYE